MSIFHKVTSAVFDLVNRGSSPYQVLEIQPQKLSSFTVVSQDGSCTLYKDNDTHLAVIHCPDLSPKAFSLFRLAVETEATNAFSSLCKALYPLYSSTDRMRSQEMLQKCCDVLRDHETWTSAHLAAFLGLKECFKQAEVQVHLNATDENTGETPLHVAIETGNLEMVQELILCDVRLDLANKEGHTVFHCAAKGDESNVILWLATKDKSAVNQLCIHGESPLHVACINSKKDNVEALLRWGADPCLTKATRYPIHCAMKVSAIECVEALCQWNRDQVNLQDKKYNGALLHWAKTKELVFLLIDRGCDKEVLNKAGESPLHIMVKRDRSECVMAMLGLGANAEAIGEEGSNALHMAIQTDNYKTVQVLIVFGSDVNHCNKAGLSPRHLAAIHKGENKDDMLYLLHKVGSKRCKPGVEGCMPGCDPNGAFNGTPKVPEIHTPELEKSKFYDSFVSELAMKAAHTRSASASSGLDSSTVEKTKVPVGDRILCLDGGGIRGLILIKLLMALEKAAGKPMRELFDWIGGTSTGGILALAIVHEKPMQYAMGFYLRFKDIVFQGTRPYDSEPLESFMKKEFGEDTRMDEKKYPRVLVTSVFCDRTPAELHFFRNYIPPGKQDYEERAASGAKFEPALLPHDQRVWQAARSSGAAPTYFRAFGKYLDGGLLSNNPTLDVMTEVHEYNMGLKAQDKDEQVKPMHVVVSLGTGRNPPKEMKDIDIWKPGGVLELYKVVSGCMNLGELLVEHATLAEGRPVDRAKAWCSMIDVPYFRFSPLLTEDIPLDCNDDDKLINMLWETQAYINKNWEKFEMLATVLKQ